MRLFLPALLATALILPTAASQDQKPALPDLKAREWKKVGDDGLEVWDVKEGKGELAKARRLRLAHRTHGSGEDREVVRAHRDPSSVDGADAGHHAVSRQVSTLGLQRRIHRVRQHAVLHEAPGIQQEIQALPHRQLAHAPLALDLLLAAMARAAARRASRSVTSGDQSYRSGCCVIPCVYHSGRVTPWA